MHRLLLVVSRVTSVDRLDISPRIVEKAAKNLLNDRITELDLYFDFVPVRK